MDTRHHPCQYLLSKWTFCVVRTISTSPHGTYCVVDTLYTYLCESVPMTTMVCTLLAWHDYGFWYWWGALIVWWSPGDMVGPYLASVLLVVLCYWSTCSVGIPTGCMKHVYQMLWSPYMMLASGRCTILWYLMNMWLCCVCLVGRWYTV